MAMTIIYRLDNQIELKRIRERKRKLTYREIAADSGVSTNTLYRMRHQVLEQIGRVTLDKLCRYLDCQPGDLIVYVPEEDLESYRDNGHT